MRGHCFVVEFSVTTPMFLGGADTTRAELRIPSIKGALRFWWRALAWRRYGNLGIKELAREEADLFGSTDAGQAVFELRLVAGDLQTSEEGDVLGDASGRPIGPGGRYLGYGLIKPAGTLDRSCLREGSTFSVEFSFRPNVGEKARESVIEAIKAFGLLGALGSRARRGYGSIAVKAISDGTAGWTNPTTIDSYIQEIRTLIGPLNEMPAGLPNYTAFSQRTRIAVVTPSKKLIAETGHAALDNEIAMLDCIGAAMLWYRSWGRGGNLTLDDSKPGRVSSVKKFQADHDWFVYGKSSSERAFHPERAVFGLPHNYFKKKFQSKDNINIEAKIGPVGYDRRASPFMIHVRSFRSDADRFASVLSIFPAKFLPDASGKEGMISMVRSTIERRQGMRSIKAVLTKESAPFAVDDFRHLHGFIDHEVMGTRILNIAGQILPEGMK